MFSNLKKLAQILTQTPKIKFSSGSINPNRPMKFPYTFSAKLAQFPYKFYNKNNWIWRYYPFALILSVPAFVYCHRLANSESNKAQWAERRRREAERHHH